MDLVTSSRESGKWEESSANKIYLLKKLHSEFVDKVEKLVWLKNNFLTRCKLM